MSERNYDNILNYLKELIESYPERALVILNQESDFNLRFIPKNLDIDNIFIEDSTKSIKKTGLKNNEDEEFSIKRAVYLEFKAKDNNLKIIIVAKQVDANEIIEISKQFSTIYPTLFENQSQATKDYFHIHLKTIISDRTEYSDLNNNNNKMKEFLRNKFIEFVPEFLKKLDLFYPIDLL